MPRRFSFHSGSSGSSAGWSPKPVSRSSSAASPAERAPLMARRGRRDLRSDASMGGTAPRPSMAPRWKIVTSTLRRREEVAPVPVAAIAARARKPGPPPTPTVTRATPPALRKSLRSNMMVVLIGTVCPSKPSPPRPSSPRGRGGRKAFLFLVLFPSLPPGERGQGSEGFGGQIPDKSTGPLGEEGRGGEGFGGHRRHLR